MKKILLIVFSILLFSTKPTWADGKVEDMPLCVYTINSNGNRTCRGSETEGRVTYISFERDAKNNTFQAENDIGEYGFFSKHFNKENIMLTEIESEKDIKLTLNPRKDTYNISVNDSRITSFLHLRNDEGVSANTFEMYVPKNYVGKSAIFTINNYYCEDELDEYKQDFLNKVMVKYKGKNLKAKPKKLKYDVEDIMFALSNGKKRELHILVKDLTELISPQIEINEISISKIISETNQDLREKCIKNRSVSKPTARFYFEE